MKVHRAVATVLKWLLAIGLAVGYLSGLAGAFGLIDPERVAGLAIWGTAFAFVAALGYFIELSIQSPGTGRWHHRS